MGAIVDVLKAVPELQIGIEVELLCDPDSRPHTHIQDVEYVTRRFRVDPETGDEEEVSHELETEEEEVECDDPDCGDGINEAVMDEIREVNGIEDCRGDGSLPDGGFEIVTDYGNVDEWRSALEDGLHRALHLAGGEGAYTDDGEMDGIHIHVSIPHFDMRNEDFLYFVWQEARKVDWDAWRSGTREYYCHDLPELFEEYLDTMTSWQYSDRYYVVNLKALVAHGTLEFRAFDSSMSMDQIAEYVSVATGVVSRAYARDQALESSGGFGLIPRRETKRKSSTTAI